MWQNFVLSWDGKEWQCEAKVYDRPSMWGIRDGRVSKLNVYDEQGNILYQYDRGWSSEKVAPEGLLDELMKAFPNHS